MIFNSNVLETKIGGFDIQIRTINHGLYAETTVSFPYLSTPYQHDETDHHTNTNIVALTPLHQNKLDKTVLDSHTEVAIAYINTHKEKFERDDWLEIDVNSFDHNYTDDEIDSIRVEALKDIPTLAKKLNESAYTQAAVRLKGITLNRGDGIVELPPLRFNECLIYILVEPDNFSIVDLSVNKLTGYPYNVRSEQFFELNYNDLKELSRLLNEKTQFKNLLMPKELAPFDDSFLPF